MANIDTIVLRIHATTDRKNSLQTTLDKVNAGIDDYVCPEHNDLYLKMLEIQGKFVTKERYLNRETWNFEPMSDLEFIEDENSRMLANKEYDPTDLLRQVKKHDANDRKLSLAYDNALHYTKRDVIVFEDGKLVKEYHQRTSGNYRVPSSNNSVVFIINHKGGFIDFNLSVPKYLYGNSLAQFVPNPGTDMYYESTSDLRTWKGQKKDLHKRLMKFIDKFLLDLVKFFNCDTLLDKKYVELRRIDLCYNQFFESKEMAIKYLELQKKINYKRQRDSSNIKDRYQTSLEYHTSSGSYFKIYHKGTEYINSERGDYQKHVKLNQEFIDDKVLKSDNKKLKQTYWKHRDTVFQFHHDRLNDRYIKIPHEIKEFNEAAFNKLSSWIDRLKPYKTDYLKNEMDKVLRYEVSLRGEFFRYAFKSKVFRASKKRQKGGRNFYTNQFHKQAFEDFKHVEAAQKAVTPRKVTKEQHYNHKHFKQWFERKIYFVLAQSPAMYDYCNRDVYDWDNVKMKYKIKHFTYSYSLLKGKDLAPFSEDFLNVCVDHFKGLVDHYQIQKMSKYDDVVQQITEYNNNVESKVEQYNIDNHYQTLDFFGKPKTKGSKVIRKAVQLLSEKEKLEYGLKKVDVTKLLVFLNEMKDGKSFDEICKELSISKFAKTRIKQNLSAFGIYQSTLTMEQEINVSTDYSMYYWLTESDRYRNSVLNLMKSYDYAS